MSDSEVSFYFINNISKTFILLAIFVLKDFILNSIKTYMIETMSKSLEIILNSKKP